MEEQQSKKKIKNTAILCYTLTSGGMPQDAIKLALQLKTHGTIYIVCKRGSFLETQIDILEKQGIQVRVIHYNKLGLLDAFPFIKKFKTFIKEENITNIILYGTSEIRFLYFTFPKGKVNFIMRHGTTKNKLKKDWFHTFLYKKINTHVGVSNHIVNNVRHVMPVAKDSKVVTIYPSSEIEKYPLDKKEMNKKHITICHTGRYVTGKGQLDALKACEILQANNIDFEIYFLGEVEDENYFTEIKNYLKQSPFANSVFIVGFTKKVEDYLLKSDIFLFPSSGEGLPNSVVEAFLSQNIPVTYSNTVFPEFKQLGLHIYLTKENTVESLKNTLLDAANNLTKEKEMIRQSTLLAQKLFAPKKEKNAFLDILW